MPMKAIFPPGSGKTLAPYSPGTMADGIVYVAGTLALDAETNVVHVGEFIAEQARFLARGFGRVAAQQRHQRLDLARQERDRSNDQ